MLRRGISTILVICTLVLGTPVSGPMIAAAVPVDSGTVTSDLRCVTFVDATTGFAAGASGVILKTTDAGASWHSVGPGGSYDFRGISFSDSTRGWVVSLLGQVFKTVDGGETWTFVSDDAGGDFYVVERFYDIDMWSSTSGFAVGGAQDTQPMVAKTTNAGSFWSVPLDFLLGSYTPPESQDPFPPDGLGDLYGLDVRSATKAWVAGQDVFKSPTLSVIWAWNGTQWLRQSVSGTGRLLDIAFGTDTAGAAVGDSGMARYTVNGGTTWLASTTGVTTELSGFDSLSTGRGWAVGQGGVILRTDDQGATWVGQNSGTGVYLEDVAVLGQTTAVAVGRGGTVLRTTDGITWRSPAEAPVVTSLESASHPADTWVSDATVNMAWTATGDIAGYGYEFDQSPTTVPVVVNTSANSTVSPAPSSGLWFAHVAARDTLGRWSAPRHRQVLVDTDKPFAFDDVDPAGYSMAATVTLTATDAHSGVASIRYSISGAATTTVPGSSATVRFSTVGDRQLTYVAVDEAGNVSQPGSATVKVNPPAAPVVTTLSSVTHPAGQWGSSASVSLAWTASSPTALAYGVVLDQSASTSVLATTTTSSAAIVTANSSGTWYAHVSARDAYGQWSPTRHLQVLVDTTKPLVSDDVDPLGYEGTATVTLSATDAHSGAASIDYSVNGAAPVHTLGTSVVFSRSVPGTYVIAYSAKDAAGNVSETGSTTVYVRPMPPPAAPVITSLASSTHPPGVWTAASSVSLAWSATGTGLVGYGLVFDQLSGTQVTDTTTTATSGLGNAPTSGAWFAHVAAQDSFSQWSATRHVQVLVDTTKPLAFDDVDPDGYVASANINLSATDGHSGVTSITYSIDGGAPTTVPAPSAQVPFDSVGEFLLTYTAEDAAGNGSLLGSATVRVDPPAAPSMDALDSSTHPAGEWSRASSVALRWLASGATDLEYGVVFDKNPSTAVGTTSTALASATVLATPPGSETGVWYAHVAARDTYGSWSTTRHLQVLVDATVPLVSDDAAPQGYQGTATVTMSATDVHSGVASVSYQVSGEASVVVPGSSAVFTRSVPGTYTLTYRATDNAGNLSATGSAVVYVTAPPPPDAVSLAVSGADRYLTAIEACDVAFGAGVMPKGPDGRRTIVLASGENWPDALSAAGLAGAHESPLLLTRKSTLPSAVAARIASLGADKVFIVGGTAAVTDGVKAAVDAIVPGSSTAVERISGATRYETASAVARYTLATQGRPAWDGTAFVATGGNFPDALAAGPLAASKGMPMYLSNPTGISAATLDAMVAARVKRVYVLGGTAAVSDATVAALRARGITFADRWAGANRYATAAAVAESSLLLGLDAIRPALAVGTNYPDALAGGVMQGRAGSAVVLTNGTSLSIEASDFLTAKAAEVREMRFLGGTAALSNSVRNAAMLCVSTP